MKTFIFYVVVACALLGAFILADNAMSRNEVGDKLSSPLTNCVERYREVAVISDSLCIVTIQYTDTVTGDDLQEVRYIDPRDEE